MSPIRVCRRCNLAPCRCRRRPRSSSSSRSYSGTAAERQMRIDVLEAYGDSCLYAGQDPLCIGGPVTLDPRWELAHVQAHADGGAFTLANIRPAHQACNRRAGRR